MNSVATNPQGRGGNLSIILVRVCGPVFFKTYPNHIAGLRKK